MKTALVIGATGLVGGELVQLLLADPRFEKVIVFARRSLNLPHPKLEEHLINFDEPSSWQDLVRGDILFSALGTTMKQAKTKAAQFNVDYTMQYAFAKSASANGVPVYVLVSAAGASPSSRIFYSRMKGELERDVKKLHFSAIHLIQPGLLVGKRKDERVGEKVGFRLLTAFNAIGLFKKYRPIEGVSVARAMINAGTGPQQGMHMYNLEEVFTLAST